ncbi:antirestriction protein ArdA [Caulobacter segnis]|uniref:Antirestriction protein ArdA n=1 Tax=Caulobacter segnis TaxID=88688 RepID=A0A2W5V1P3_9CAUL|nr:antirestriction protein ArdA [Caulobacter segnis]PZR33222.1 MAG: antirestriction protein ArdA [Caulobacter segnis]
MTQALETLEPRVYVACLAAYNSGVLHGAWIDVEDEDQVLAAIAAMLAASPTAGAEEYAIHDYEDFGGVEIGEYAAIARVVEIATFLRARGALGALVLAEVGGDLEAAAAALDDQYHGVFASLADCFQELTEETTAIPETLRLYIDYEAMARDARLNGEVFTVETGPGAVHVFWSR